MNVRPLSANDLAMHTKSKSDSTDLKKKSTVKYDKLSIGMIRIISIYFGRSTFITIIIFSSYYKN